MKGKILIVGPVLKTYGGVSRFQEDLLDSQIDYDFAHFNTARPPKLRSVPDVVPGYREVISAGLLRAAIAIVVTGWHIMAFSWALFRERADLVHIAAVTYWPFWESAAYLWISKVFRARVVLHMLAPFDIFYVKGSTAARWLIRTVLGRADHLLCLSERDRAVFSTLFPSGSISVLRSNVDLRSCSDHEVDRQDRERVNVLFVGGVDPFRKGINDILMALPVVIEAHRECLFTFTGGENLQCALDESLDPRLRPWVSYLGWIDEGEKGELYRSADLLVLPSYEEGLPYVIVEAMAAGLPIVATPVGAIPEVINDGINGLLVKPGDYRALADKLLTLCRNEGLRSRIGRANRERARLLFSQEVVFQELETIYDHLINDLPDRGDRCGDRSH